MMLQKGGPEGARRVGMTIGKLLQTSDCPKEPRVSCLIMRTVVLTTPPRAIKLVTYMRKCLLEINKKI